MQKECIKRCLLELARGASGNMGGEKKSVLRVMSCKYPSNSPHVAAALIRGDPNGVVRQQRPNILTEILPVRNSKRKDTKSGRPIPRRTQRKRTYMRWSCQYPSSSNHAKIVVPSDVEQTSTESDVAMADREEAQPSIKQCDPRSCEGSGRGCPLGLYASQHLHL